MLKQLLIDGLKGRSKEELSILHNESEEEASRLFDELCAEKEHQIYGDGARDTFKTIPCFYKAMPKDNEVVKHKLREEARALFLQRKSNALIDNEELQKLWFLLEENKTENAQADDHLISYRNFKFVGSKCSPKSQSFFTAKAFFKIYTGDKSGEISIMQFFNYVMRKVWLQQTRIGLSLYDVSGRGFLREMDLENYILELIPTLPQLQGLEKTFYSFYVCTAVRKFFFFLDPLKTSRIRIQDILACSFLDDLLELRDEELSQELQDSNWFSASSVLRIYGNYLNLDRDHNGMLSRQELQKYGTGSLSPVFLERIYEECLTYEGELDYKSYLDFVLAYEYRQEPASIQYFFKLLDIDKKSYLTRWDLNYFFRSIQTMMRDLKQEPVNFGDVSDEIFDMVRPADPCKITLRDMIDCGQGGTVVRILIDLNEFWIYENRESLLAEQED